MFIGVLGKCCSYIKLTTKVAFWEKPADSSEYIVTSTSINNWLIVVPIVQGLIVLF